MACFEVSEFHTKHFKMAYKASLLETQYQCCETIDRIQCIGWCGTKRKQSRIGYNRFLLEYTFQLVRYASDSNQSDVSSSTNIYV